MAKHDRKFLQQNDKADVEGIRVDSKGELADRIYLYFDEVNREPVVYRWSYKTEEISVEEATV